MKKNKNTIALSIIAFGICLIGITLLIIDKIGNEGQLENLSSYGVIVIFIGLIANQITKNKGFGWRIMWKDFINIFKL